MLNNLLGGPIATNNSSRITMTFWISLNLQTGNLKSKSCFSSAHSTPSKKPKDTNNHTHVNPTERPYSIADDTLIIQNDLINRSGYQKIRNGQRLPKQYQVKQWKRNSPDAPFIRIDGKHACWNNTIYLQIP